MLELLDNKKRNRYNEGMETRVIQRFVGVSRQTVNNNGWNSMNNRELIVSLRQFVIDWQRQIDTLQERVEGTNDLIELLELTTTPNGQ